MIGIDQIAYDSRISLVKTEIKLIFAGIPLLFCLFSASKVICLVILIEMILANLLYGKILFKTLLEQFMIPIFFLLTGVLTIIVNYIDEQNYHILLSFHLFNSQLGITEESLSQGIQLFIKAMAAVSCLYFFSFNTPMNSFFSFLRRVRFPIIFIELMELMYRFIFILKSESIKIVHAQESRLGYKGFRNSLHSLGELVTNIFLRSLKRVDRINASLESRGFDGRLDTILDLERMSPSLLLGAGFMTVINTLLLIVERLMI